MTEFTEGQEVFILTDNKVVTMTVHKDMQSWGVTWVYLRDQEGYIQNVSVSNIYLTNPEQGTFDFDLTDQDNNEK